MEEAGEWGGFHLGLSAGTVGLQECSGLGMPSLTMPPEALLQLPPLLLSHHQRGRGPYPAGSAVPALWCQVIPISSCNGRLCPFTISKNSGSPTAAPRLVFSQQKQPPAQCPCHSPATAMGTMGSPGLCWEGSIPDPLHCCVLELAGGLSIDGLGAMGP